MAVLSDEQLKNLLQGVVSPKWGYPPCLFDAYSVLYASGCRREELLDRSRWSLLANNVISLLPMKGNNIRYFQVLDLPSTFVFYVANGGSYFSFLSSYKLVYYFKRFSPYPPLKVKGKVSVLHLFRHNYVRQKVVAGLSDSEIVTLMGWQNESVLQHYKESIVYF